MVNYTLPSGHTCLDRRIADKQILAQESAVSSPKCTATSACGHRTCGENRAPSALRLWNALLTPSTHSGLRWNARSRASCCDARILSIFEGAAEIQAQVIVRRLLDCEPHSPRIEEHQGRPQRFRLHGPDGAPVSELNPVLVRSILRMISNSREHVIAEDS
jgi:hypothetical protein